MVDQPNCLDDADMSFRSPRQWVPAFWIYNEKVLTPGCWYWMRRTDQRPEPVFCKSPTEILSGATNILPFRSLSNCWWSVPIRWEDAHIPQEKWEHTPEMIPYYVLIKDERFVGEYLTYDAALAAGYTRYSLESFKVQRIPREEHYV